MIHKLYIPKPKVLLANDQIREKKKRLDTDSVYDFIVCNCACNITKEVIELIIEKLITQNVIFIIFIYLILYTSYFQHSNVFETDPSHVNRLTVIEFKMRF